MTVWTPERHQQARRAIAEAAGMSGIVAASGSTLAAALDEIERLQGLLRVEMDACDKYRKSHDTMAMGCPPDRPARIPENRYDTRCGLCRAHDAKRAVGCGREN